MNKIIKLSFIISLLYLTSCTTDRARAIALSKSYSCPSFVTWIASIKELIGSDKFVFLKPYEVAELIAPAFNDDVFQKAFGKPFNELSKNESEGIWRSMVTCRVPSWMAHVSAPFHHEKLYKGERDMWLGYIEDASKKSYSSIVAKRKKAAASKKLVAKNAAVQRRLATDRRTEEMNKRFEEFKKNYIAIHNRAYPEETRDEANNYANYGACAEKLRSRLAHCYVGAGSCDSSGNCSKNSVHCDKGIFGTQCIETIYLTAPRHIDYYCDIQNSRDYNENRKAVIQQICLEK